MYLEISARQTGKTTRLVKAIAFHIISNENNYASVLSMSHDMFKNIFRGLEKLLSKECLNRIFFSQSMYDTTYLKGLKINRHKHFIDEFDFIDSRKLYVDENAYYVTTPKRIRNYNHSGFEMLGASAYNITDDILMILVKIQKPVQFINTGNGIQEKSVFEKSQARTEFLADYNKE